MILKAWVRGCQYVLMVVVWCYAITVSAVPTDALSLTTAEQHWLETHPQVTVAFDGYFPPFSFLNEEAQLEGFALDVFAILAERTGISFQFAPLHRWQDIYTRDQ